MRNPFSETNNYFRTYLSYTKPYSYTEWLALSDEKKAAALYVQFYEQITLAWFKTKSYYAEDEVGVTTMLQYLMKNVPIIIKDSKRFSEKYIYRVAYNCLYCVCHDIKSDKERAEFCTSNVVGYGENELDLFDTVPDNADFQRQLDYEEMWSIIAAKGPKAMKIINYLLNGDPLTKTSKLSKSYASDPLRDVEVSLDEMNRIISELRTELSEFKSLFGLE